VQDDHRTFKYFSLCHQGFLRNSGLLPLYNDYAKKTIIGDVKLSLGVNVNVLVCVSPVTLIWVFSGTPVYSRYIMIMQKKNNW